MVLTVQTRLAVEEEMEVEEVNWVFVFVKMSTERCDQF